MKPTEKQRNKITVPEGGEQSIIMSSYRQILYHIIFRTKDSELTLPLAQNDELYKYIWGFVKQKNCVLYRINGMEDHIHMLSDLHPSIALADFIRDLKVSTSIWLKENPLFPNFKGWADGYAALTYAYRDKGTIVNYIKNQQEHHKTTTFMEEYRKLLEEEGVLIDDRYFP